MPYSFFNLPISDVRSFICRRLTVFKAPRLRACMQLNRLTSSMWVRAIKKSAPSAPALIRVSWDAPLPTTPPTLYKSVILSTRVLSLSITVISCSSWESALTRVIPASPRPTIIIFILFLSFALRVCAFQGSYILLRRSVPEPER